MSKFLEIEKKCDYLELSGIGPKNLVSLLGLRAWREDKLEEEYYKQTSLTFKLGPSNFKHLIIELLRFGLIKEKEGTTGYRFSLNKKVWSQDTELFKAINLIALYFHENLDAKLRSDANLKTFQKRISNKLKDTRYGGLSWSIMDPIVGTIMFKKRDFQNDQSIRQFAFAKRTAEQIRNSKRKSSENIQCKQPGFSSITQEKSKSVAEENQNIPCNESKKSIVEIDTKKAFVNPIAGLTDDTPTGMPVGAVRILNPVEFWPGVEEALKKDNLRSSVFADRNSVGRRFKSARRLQ